MSISSFMNLIKCGFDVSFNYKNVFYTISLLQDDSQNRKYGIGGDNGFAYDFESLESIPDYILDGKSIKDIVAQLKKEEVFF